MIMSMLILSSVSSAAYATGTAGPIGPAGPAGAIGAKGATGSQGIAGPTGASGAKGATGSQGIAGPTGASGAKGATGNNGTNGTNGTTGATGTIGATGATGTIGTTGTTLNALASDVQANLSLGPTNVVSCYSNPYISGDIPCAPAISACPSGSTPLKTSISCTNLPSLEITTINAIIGNNYIFSNMNGQASINPTTNSLSCSAPGTYNAPGFTPWCFYKISGSTFGIADPWNRSYVTNATDGTTVDVSETDYNNPLHWQCFPIEVQAQAQCIVLPTKVKSILNFFGTKIP